MKLKSFFHAGFAAGLALSLCAVACAPKDKKAKTNPRATAQAVNAKAQRLHTDVLPEAATGYDPKAENNRRFADRLAGATLTIEQWPDARPNSEGKRVVQAAGVVLQVLLKDVDLPIIAAGQVTKDLAPLQVDPDHCGKTDLYTVRARCFGSDCSKIAVLIEEKAKAANGQDASNLMAIYFIPKTAVTATQTRRQAQAQPGQEQRIAQARERARQRANTTIASGAPELRIFWSASKDGVSSGPTLTVEAALRDRDQRVARNQMQALTPYACDAAVPTTDPNANPGPAAASPRAAAGREGATSEQREADELAALIGGQEDGQTTARPAGQTPAPATASTQQQQSAAGQAAAGAGAPAAAATQQQQQQQARPGAAAPAAGTTQQQQQQLAAGQAAAGAGAGAPAAAATQQQQQQRPGAAAPATGTTQQQQRPGAAAPAAGATQQQQQQQQPGAGSATGAADLSQQIASRMPARFDSRIGQLAEIRDAGCAPDEPWRVCLERVSGPRAAAGN